jgi:hypothetical protein
MEIQQEYPSGGAPELGPLAEEQELEADVCRPQHGGSFRL